MDNENIIALVADLASKGAAAETSLRYTQKHLDETLVKLIKTEEQLTKVTADLEDKKETIRWYREETTKLREKLKQYEEKADDTDGT